MESSWMKALFPLLGVVIGAGVTFICNKILNQRKLRLDIELKVYEQLTEIMVRTEAALVRFDSLLQKVKLDLQQSEHLDEQHWKATLRGYVSTEDISEAHRQFDEQYFAFSSFLQRYGVVFPYLTKFQRIIGEKHSELSRLYYDRVTEELRWAIPIKRNNELFLNAVRRLSSDDFGRVQTTIDRAGSLKLDIVIYLDDLDVYVQKHSLAKLFGREVHARRAPPTAKYAVIEGNERSPKEAA